MWKARSGLLIAFSCLTGCTLLSDFSGASDDVDFDANSAVNSPIELWAIEDSNFVSGGLLVDGSGNPL